MDRTAIDAAASTLAEAWKSGQLIQALPPGSSPPTLNEAWVVQDAVVALIGEPVMGWKVARTPDGVFLPGPVLKSRVFPSGARIRSSLTPLRGVEAEIAFRFNRDFPARDYDYTREEIEDSVTPMIGFEIVDSRFNDYKSAPMWDKSADLQSNGGFVQGPEIPNWRKQDLVNVEVTLKINGKITHQANGGHPAKDPLIPAIILANINRHSKGIAAGQFATTGTYTGMQFVNAGDFVQATFEGAGSVEFTFSP